MPLCGFPEYVKWFIMHKETMVQHAGLFISNPGISIPVPFFSSEEMDQKKVMSHPFCVSIYTHTAALFTILDHSKIRYVRTDATAWAHCAHRGPAERVQAGSALCFYLRQDVENPPNQYLREWTQAMLGWWGSFGSTGSSAGQPH